MARSRSQTRGTSASISEQICDHADVEGDGYNPFRNMNGQMIANVFDAASRRHRTT
jgi:hypothetical protein